MKVTLAIRDGLITLAYGASRFMRSQRLCSIAANAVLQNVSTGDAAATLCYYTALRGISIALPAMQGWELEDSLTFLLQQSFVCKAGAPETAETLHQCKILCHNHGVVLLPAHDRHRRVDPP